MGGKGRKKVVQQFTPKQAALMLGLVLLLGMIFVLLYVLGILHLDAD
jgi:hypothetical protein